MSASRPSTDSSRSTSRALAPASTSRFVSKDAPFDRAVWNALQEIPYGNTASYGEIAERIGRPGRARAVGAANARNPIAIVVPCHRVIGANGKLTGYGGGLGAKRALLSLEGSMLDM